MEITFIVGRMYRYGCFFRNGQGIRWNGKEYKCIKAEIGGPIIFHVPDNLNNESRPYSLCEARTYWYPSPNKIKRTVWK